MRLNEKTNLLKFTLAFLVLSIGQITNAQLTFEDGVTEYIIDFEGSVPGVSNGAFEGLGFASNPSVGQLDANAWATTGCSDGAKVFGLANTTGDHARGYDDGGVAVGGIYSFDTGGGNRTLGIQPTGSDYTPGTLTMKIHNNSSVEINEMQINYVVYEKNDQDHSSTFSLSFSYSNISFANISSGSHTTVQQAAGNAWVPSAKSVNLTGLQIAPQGDFYIRWSSSDANGSGSRDEIALDDIIISIQGESVMCEEPTSQGSNLTLDLISSSFIQGSFSGGTADKYLIIQSNNSSLGAEPIDGLSYAVGSQLGTGTVIQYSALESFNSIGLNQLTDYYYFVYASNDVCDGGPDYLLETPLTVMGTTTEDDFGGYYASIDNQTCAELKTALFNLIDGHTSVSYGSLWTHYQTTDDRLNDTGNAVIVWDMYSDNPTGSENEFTFVSEQCGTYQQEGQCYNREHTFPKSWWGGSTTAPQYTDIFAVVPADGWINGIRSNNPYGEVQSGTETQFTDNGSVLGASSTLIPGYSANVFEPIDAFKGDLARGYLYMATRYEDEIATWETNTTESDAVLSGDAYTVFEPWMLDMLLDWHQLDPVDQKEIDRNEAIFTIQGNRNPFIDHPEYANAIWETCNGPAVDSCLLVYSTLDNGAGSLRAAIACASSGDTIGFSSDVFNSTLIINSDSLLVDKQITILADTSSNIMVSVELPQVNPQSTIFRVTPVGNLSLHGLTINGGFGPNSTAIRNSGNLLLESVTFVSATDPATSAVLINDIGATLQLKGINTIK